MKTSSSTAGKFSLFLIPATSADYRQHHILSAKDDPDPYIRDMLAVL